MTEYYIPTKRSEARLVEKRSEFIGRVWPVDSEEQARACIEAARKHDHAANHHCWCYIIRDGAVRYSDDGEPQGTAGQPMLNVFQREGIENVCCVVTRSFGGILLGAGGLVRAYSQSAKDALDAAGISVVRRWVSMELPCSYNQFEVMRREALAYDGVVDNIDYGADVVLSLLLPEERADDFVARIVDVSAGTVEPLVAGEEFKPVVWKEAK